MQPAVPPVMDLQGINYGWKSGSSGNHPGIIDYKGKTYCFGFNYAINFSETTVHRERRSVCVAEITFKEDGTIPKLPWWGGKMPSSAGVEQVGSLNPYDTVQAETICWSQGVETEACTEGGLNVGFIENGDFIKVKRVDFGTGATSFDARVASNTNGRKMNCTLTVWQEHWLVPVMLRGPGLAELGYQYLRGQWGNWKA